MSIKSTIDKHFADNYTYYKSVCKRYYNGRYLAEDLLHELYLKLSNSNPEQIERYHKANKLNCLGLLIIKDLFRHRTQKLFHIDGNTSNLFEGANFEILDFKQVDEEYIPIDEVTIERIKNTIFDGLLNQDHDIEVFVMAQIEPLYRMEQRTKINRSSLKKAYENARIKLKNQLK